MRVYLVDVGVLLTKEDDEFEAYAVAYDKKHGFYDENQYYCADREQAIKEAKDYVKDGVVGTYGIVSETDVSDDVDLNDCPVESEAYLLEDVIFSATKVAENEIKENFLEA